MSKRKQIQYNLINNSISAYFAAIELHNKPMIPYRYETATLLIINAWELLLKAYIRKYIKSKTIFEKDGHTISLDKSLGYVESHINIAAPKSFTAVKENIILIEQFRNNVIHYYNEQLEPYIFMLLARCALNYTEFVKKYFKKDIIADEGLFIMPLGFKLPFKPQDFLSQTSPSYMATKEAKQFIDSVVNTISTLKDNGIEESVVVEFDVFLQSVKKVSNSDLIVAISDKDEASATITTSKSYKLTNDPKAQSVKIEENDLRKIYPLSYQDFLKECKNKIANFKQNALFRSLHKQTKNNANFSYTRKLDDKNPKSPSKVFYTASAVDEMIRLYSEETA